MARERIDEQTMHDVFALNARGFSRSEIAQRCSIGLTTVQRILTDTWSPRAEQNRERDRIVAPAHKSLSSIYGGRVYDDEPDAFKQVGLVAKSLVQAMRNRAGV